MMTRPKMKFLLVICGVLAVAALLATSLILPAARGATIDDDSDGRSLDYSFHDGSCLLLVPRSTVEGDWYANVYIHADFGQGWELVSAWVNNTEGMDGPCLDGQQTDDNDLSFYGVDAGMQVRITIEYYDESETLVDTEVVTLEV